MAPEHLELGAPMTEAARLATVIVRLVALVMMTVGPLSLVSQSLLAPEVFGSVRMVTMMLIGAAIITVPGYLLYRFAPRIGHFVSRGLD